MIYKFHELERIAGNLLIDDYKNDPKLHFTNTSFGCSGDVLGSLEYKDSKTATEKTVIYYTEREGGWDSNKINLIKETTTTKWQIKRNDTIIQEYSRTKDKDIIMTLYIIDDNYSIDRVYTDDEEYSKNATKKRYERYKNNRLEKSEERFYDIVDKNRYNEMFDYIRVSENNKIKYGTPISTKLSRGIREIYNYSNHRYENKNYVELIVKYIYRNQTKCFTKSHTEY